MECTPPSRLSTSSMEFLIEGVDPQWVSCVLCAQVDSYGSFAYVLLKVADRSGVKKLLVRGKNLSSEQQMLQVRHPSNSNTEH